MLMGDSLEVGKLYNVHYVDPSFNLNRISIYKDANKKVNILGPLSTKDWFMVVQIEPKNASYTPIRILSGGDMIGYIHNTNLLCYTEYRLEDNVDADNNNQNNPCSGDVPAS